MCYSNHLRHPVLTIAAALVLSTAASAAVLDVPASFPTIQDAIDIAANGDEVVVDSGTYNENINFLGKGIIVRSLNGPVSTVIDGGGVGAVASFSNGEGASSILDGFTLRDGDSPYGGGLRCDGSSPTVIECVIIGNHAYCGAGVYCRNSDLTLDNCLLIFNRAGHNGGGIYCESGSTPIVLRCDIRRNRAANGAGIYSTASDLMLVNCTLAENRATGSSGGALHLHTSAAIIANCTITGNQAQYYGGGVLCYNSAAEVVNSILWRNRAYGAPDEACLLDAAATMTIDYSDVNPAFISGAGTWSGANNINANPLFVAPASGDFHLDPLSPCIDVGTDDTGTYPYLPSDDIDGDSRPLSGTGYTPPEFDMGSDELVVTLIIEPIDRGILRMER